MKVYFLKSILMGLIFGHFASTASARDTLILYAINYPPYTIEDPSSDGLTGFDVEVVRAAFRQVGVRAEIRYEPWKRILASLENGDYLAGVSCGYNESRTTFIHYSDPISKASNAFVIPKSKADMKVDTLQDLENLKVLAVDSYGVNEDLRKAGIKFDTVTSMELALQVLLRRGYDVLYVPKEGPQYVAKQMGLSEKLDFRPVPGKQTRNYFVCFSRKFPGSDKIRDLFNKGLQAIQQDGTFNAIHARYR